MEYSHNTYHCKVVVNAHLAAHITDLHLLLLLYVVSQIIYQYAKHKVI